eukprot:scaffold41203_cov199-Amphora_coffeaeformis.AAC.1
MKLCFLGLALIPAIGQASTVPLPPWSSRKQSSPLPDDEYQALLVPWIQSRTASTSSLDQVTPDGQPASLWLYQGSLMDPLTGKVLAIVEGFEVVKLKGLWQNDTAIPATKSRLNKQSSLEKNVTSFLDHLPVDNPVTNWTRTLLQRSKGMDDQAMKAAAVWESRKVFLYRSTDEGNDMLTTVRLRPTGPKRKVPLSQAISTWHATTTVLQPDSRISRNDNTSQAFFFGTALNTQSSSPSTTSTTLVWNTAPVVWEDAIANTAATRTITKRRKAVKKATAVPTGNLEFTIHARPRRGEQGEALRRHFAQQSRPTGLAPPRAALVSLGDGGASQMDASAAHETYRYSLPGGRLSYSRYGEGPVWYGPHRTCRLELRGQHMADLQQLSPVVRELVRRLVTAPSLDVDVLFPEEVQARQATQPAWIKHVQVVQPYWRRLVQATSVQAIPERSL